MAEVRVEELEAVHAIAMKFLRRIFTEAGVCDYADIQRMESEVWSFLRGGGGWKR